MLAENMRTLSISSHLLMEQRHGDNQQGDYCLVIVGP
jgi:hypothetical protein